MDGSIYQKILEAYTDVDSAKRGKLLRRFAHSVFTTKTGRICGTVQYIRSGIVLNGANF